VACPGDVAPCGGFGEGVSGVDMLGYEGPMGGKSREKGGPWDGLAVVLQSGNK
jgi:hypothetical protein